MPLPVPCPTGEKTIDAHHKQLAKLIDGAVESISTGKVDFADVEILITDIEDFAQKHFDYEEEVIARKCPASISSINKTGHAYFRARIVALRAMQSFFPAMSTYASALTLLRNWFYGHVCDVDCRLREFIGKGGQ